MKKIIAIEGFSAAGKSTAAQIFQKYLGGEIYEPSGTEGFNYFLTDNKPFLEKTIGSFEGAEGYFKQVFSHYDMLIKNTKFIDECITRLHISLNKLVSTEIKKIQSNVIIIPQHGISEFSSVWTKHNILIYIDVNETERENFFNKRKEENPNDAFNGFQKALRDMVNIHAIRGKKTADYVIKNNYDKNFERDIKNICDKIK